MSQLWVKLPLSLPPPGRLPAHWDAVSSLQVFRGLSGDKESIYSSCTGLGSRSHLCYRPGLWPSLPAAGTEDGGSSWTGNPPPCLGAEPCSQERAVKQAGSPLVPSPCSPWLRGGSWPSISVSPAGRTSLRTEPPLGQDEMEVPKHAHSHRDTHTRTGGRRAGGHTLTGTALAVTGV